jgi:hypothetical protein
MYLYPGYFFMVATDPRMILASKELHILLSSPKDPMLQMHCKMPTSGRRPYVLCSVA